MTCLFGAACRRSEDRSVGAGRQAESALPPDTSFPGDQQVTLWEVSLRQEILLPDSATIGEEPEAVSVLRRQLAR
ncbi:MAG: hypothetical protein RBU30_26085, partial [Polyangia bacterium]|nr:hypothetical protein [Polyangia bacterium]